MSKADLHLIFLAAPGDEKAELELNLQLGW